MHIKIQNIVMKFIGKRASFLLYQLKYSFFRLYRKFIMRQQIIHAKLQILFGNHSNLLKDMKFQTQSESKNDRFGNIGIDINKVMPQRDKIHVLFVTEKWCDGTPEAGPTNSEHNLFGSLEASGLATYDKFHFDQYYHTHNSHGDNSLLIKCLKTKPDLLVITWLFTPNRFINPKLSTIYIIQKELKIPIVAIWFDSVWPHIMDIAEALLPFSKFNVVLDTTKAFLFKSQHPEKYLSMWTPQDPRIFFNDNVDRKIDINFIGSIAGFHDRQAGINALNSNGIEVYKAGGQRENPLSIEQYARSFMISKIALNFCYTKGNNPFIQTKGRIFEATLCGAMLLDAENSETSSWYKPYIEYVPFKDENDLVYKAKYYLENVDERTKIANAGYQKAIQKYTGYNFWKTIFNKADIIT